MYKPPSGTSDETELNTEELGKKGNNREFI
jgi:hypothetical protein